MMYSHQKINEKIPKTHPQFFIENISGENQAKHLKRKQQRLKKTGQFSYVMAVELVHIFGKGAGPCRSRPGGQ